MACLLGGCAYGRPVPPPQRIFTVDWPDLHGVYAFRLPSQALGVLLASILLLASRRLSRQPGLFLALLGLGDLLIAFTRGDQMVVWGPLTPGQWADLTIIAIGLGLWWLQGKRPDLAHPAAKSGERAGV